MSKNKSITALVLLVPGLFLAVNVVHFRFFPVRVVLYDSLLDVAIAGVLAGAFVWRRWRRSFDVSVHELTLAGAVGILLCVIYAVMVPTVIDRSLSIYILEKLDHRGGGILKVAMADVFKSEYLPEFRLVDVRLTEQVNSGTIEIRDGCVVLTQLGRKITWFARFYRTWLLPRKRELLGTYSDILIDPFRNSAADVSYRCTAPDN